MSEAISTKLMANAQQNLDLALRYVVTSRMLGLYHLERFEKARADLGLPLEAFHVTQNGVTRPATNKIIKEIKMAANKSLAEGMLQEARKRAQFGFELKFFDQAIREGNLSLGGVGTNAFEVLALTINGGIIHASKDDVIKTSVAMDGSLKACAKVADQMYRKYGAFFPTELRDELVKTGMFDNEGGKDRQKQAAYKMAIAVTKAASEIHLKYNGTNVSSQKAAHGALAL